MADVAAPKRPLSLSPPPSTSSLAEAKKAKLDLPPTRPQQQPKKKNSKPPRKHKAKPPKPGGAEETLHHSIVALLDPAVLEELDLDVARAAAEKVWGVGGEGKIVEVQVKALSAHGDGLATLTLPEQPEPTRVLCVPFALPEETVRVRIHRHESAIHLSHGDLLAILVPSPLRALDDHEEVDEEVGEELRAVQEMFGKRVRCRYFGKCSGCQYQPLSYASQLSLKKTIITNAFAHFSALASAFIPTVEDTLPSPKQWAYRTKLTPHFMAPPKGKEDGWECTIGFEEKGRKRIVDIEECVIATPVINEKLVTERARIQSTIKTFKRGATLLLRDSLPPRPASSTAPHIAITDHHAEVRELVGSFELTQLAGSFFQNNNSILPSLLAYISAALPPTPDGEKRYLVDTYCGSGLFAVALAGRFDVVKGVEIDKASVRFAKANGEFNKGEGRGEVSFVDGKAEEIFSSITSPADQTTVLIDPPRKGCDDLFLDQLLAFKPKMVIYVSCNVHTQARDVGILVTKGGYRIESLRAADLFPQTHHAEGVAVLVRD